MRETTRHGAVPPGGRRSALMLAAGMAALVLGGLFPAAAAEDGPRQVAQAAGAIRFDIAAQPLDAALAAYGAASGVQLVYDSALTDGLSSPGLSGDYAPEEALRRLLAGSGLAARFTGPLMATIAPAAAGAAPGPLDPVVVSATRAERPVSSIPGAVVVIGRAEIEKQLAMSSDGAEVLEKLIPGFSVSNETMSGASETFRGRNILVLVDGVPRNTPLRNVSRTLSLIDLNNVERIEVVACASSLYGSGATGGTVNFITRSAGAAPSVTAAASLRAFTADIGESVAPELSLSAGGDAGIVDYSATLSGRMVRETYDGRGRELPSDAMIGQGGGDRIEDFNAAAKLGRNFDARRLELGVEWTYLDQEPKYLTDYGLDPAQPDKTQPYEWESVREDSKYLTARFSDADFALGALDVTSFYNDVEKRFSFAALSAVNPAVYYSGDPLDPVSDDGQSVLDAERVGISATVDSDLSDIVPTLRFTWGGDYVRDDTEQYFLDDVDAIAPMSQDSFAGFGQLEVTPVDWLVLRGGARYEHFDLTVDDFTRPAYWAGVLIPAVDVIGGEFDYSEVTYNLGAVVYLDDSIEVYGGFSQGFELPDVGSFTRRAGLGMTGTIDYSAIGPEAQLVNHYEAGLRGGWSAVRAELTGFISTSEKGVNFDPVSNTIVQQEEMIYGVELTGEVDVTDALTIGSVLTYREGRRDTDSDGDLDAYLPNNRIASPFRGVLYADYLFDSGLDLHLELEHFSGRNQNDGSAKVKLQPGTTVNIAGSYPLLGGEASFGVVNLFDAYYENPTASATRNRSVAGFGRTVSIGYRVTF